MPGRLLQNNANPTPVKALSDDCVVLIVGTNGTIKEHVSGDPEDLLGVSHLPGSSRIGDLLCPQIAAALRQNIRHCLRSRKPYRLEATWLRANSESQIELQVLPNGRDTALVMVRDRTSVARFNARVHELAFRDPLTGLPNEAALMHALVDAVSDSQLREQKLAVMRIRLNGVRSINHNFGRDAGNEVLAESARRLAVSALSALPGVAALKCMLNLQLARTRGDEFTLLVKGAPSADGLRAIADAVHERLSQAFNFADNRLDISSSIGVAVFPLDGAEAKSLLCNADTALGDATLAGGNALKFFSEAEQAARNSRHDLEHELRWALEQDQFSLVYLPCTNLRTGAVVSVEALLRWRHPLRGDVPVDEIIPLTELTGLAEEIGAWVTQQACQAAAICRNTADIMVSLNMGARHAVAKQTPARIAEQILLCGLKPSRMQLEIRAADYFRHRKTMERSVSELRSRGIGVVLDDFRADTLHLASLAGSGVHTLKISRALIANIASDETVRRCTAAIIAMAHSLGIACSATGVENQRQFDILEDMQCDAFQGFLESEPLTISALVNHLESANVKGGEVTSA